MLLLTALTLSLSHAPTPIVVAESCIGELERFNTHISARVDKKIQNLAELDTRVIISTGTEYEPAYNYARNCTIEKNTIWLLIDPQTRQTKTFGNHTKDIDVSASIDQHITPRLGTPSLSAGFSLWASDLQTQINTSNKDKTHLSEGGSNKTNTQPWWPLGMVAIFGLVVLGLLTRAQLNWVRNEVTNSKSKDKQLSTPPVKVTLEKQELDKPAADDYHEVAPVMTPDLSTYAVEAPYAVLELAQVTRLMITHPHINFTHLYQKADQLQAQLDQAAHAPNPDVVLAHIVERTDELNQEVHATILRLVFIRHRLNQVKKSLDTHTPDAYRALMHTIATKFAASGLRHTQAPNVYEALFISTSTQAENLTSATTEEIVDVASADRQLQELEHHNSQLTIAFNRTSAHVRNLENLATILPHTHRRLSTELANTAEKLDDTNLLGHIHLMHATERLGEATIALEAGELVAASELFTAAGADLADANKKMRDTSHLLK